MTKFIYNFCYEGTVFLNLQNDATCLEIFMSTTLRRSVAISSTRGTIVPLSSIRCKSNVLFFFQPVFVLFSVVCFFLFFSMDLRLIQINK